VKESHLRSEPAVSVLFLAYSHATAHRLGLPLPRAGVDCLVAEGGDPRRSVAQQSDPRGPGKESLISRGPVLEREAIPPSLAVASSDSAFIKNRLTFWSLLFLWPSVRTSSWPTVFMANEGDSFSVQNFSTL
jgi:hypothetical protein